MLFLPGLLSSSSSSFECRAAIFKLKNPNALADEGQKSENLRKSGGAQPADTKKGTEKIKEKKER